MLPGDAAARPSPHRAVGQGSSPTGMGSGEQHGLLKKNIGLKRRDREHIYCCFYEDQIVNQDKLRTVHAMGPLPTTHRPCSVPTGKPAASKAMRRWASLHTSGCDLWQGLLLWNSPAKGPHTFLLLSWEPLCSLHGAPVNEHRENPPWAANGCTALGSWKPCCFWKVRSNTEQVKSCHNFLFVLLRDS